MMRYAFDSFLPAGTTWRDLFDVVVLGASKPGFFTHRAPLFPLILSPVVKATGPDGAYALTKIIVAVNALLVALVAWRCAGALAGALGGVVPHHPRSSVSWHAVPRPARFVARRSRAGRAVRAIARAGSRRRGVRRHGVPGQGVGVAAALGAAACLPCWRSARNRRPGDGVLLAFGARHAVVRLGLRAGQRDVLCWRTRAEPGDRHLAARSAP
jgi:hypothetical protein